MKSQDDQDETLAHPSGETKEEMFATQRDPRLRLFIPLVVAFAFLMEQIDSTIIVVAIPQMASELGTTVLRMNLAITAYAVTLAVFIPISGWFADRFGARRIFSLALCIFTLGSILCGMATSLEMLVATRVLQGLGGAMMTPVGRLILLRSFPREQLFTAMIYMSLPALLGPAIGPLLGGVLTSYVSWRWIFYVNIPFGLAGILLCLRFIDAPPSDLRVGFDVPGFLMVGSGLALLQFGIESLTDPATPLSELVAIGIVAAGFLCAFVWYSRRVTSPAIDLSLFRFRSFIVGTLAGGLCRIGINGALFLLPLMLQVGFGMSAIVSGSLTFFASVGAMIVRLISIPLLKTFGFKHVLIVSAILSSVMMVGFSFMTPDTPHWYIAIYTMAFGLVRATQLMSANSLAYADMPSEQLSRATSLGGVLQQISMSLGVSISATLLSSVAISAHSLVTDDFHQVFLLVALIPLLSIPGFLFLKPQDGARVSQYESRKTTPDA
ncbi:MAG: DHA2 family efflux MFS transporter permease subunit [Dongiaceae bacterium]